MTEKRITVWVQRFKDRDILMLQWIDPATNKRKSKSAETTDPDVAEQARADKEYELNHNLHREPSRMTWASFREMFTAEYVETRRQSTRYNYGVMFDAFERLCSPRSLRSVTERTVSQFAAALRRQRGKAKDSTEQAPATIHQRLALLKRALAWAVQQKLIPELPQFPSVKIPKKRPQPIPAESFEKLLDKAPDANMRTYLLAGWLGGLRLTEAAALEREQTDKAPYLDLARDRIIFPAEFVKAVEDQWVPLDPILREAIEALPQHGRKVFRFATTDGRLIGPNSVSRRVVRLAKLAGVKLTMHSLRKGFGCRYAGQVPAQVLQKLMRHSNINLTMNFYANVDDAVMNAVLGQRNSSRNSQAINAAAISASEAQTQRNQGDV